MNKKNISTKVFVLLLAVMLLLGCTVGGTVAYLMNKSATVTNTFSTSNIQIELKETTGNDYKLVPGKNILDMEDFVVSNLLLPGGSLLFIIFCTTRYGWGWESFLAEANEGHGLKTAKWLRPYVTWVLPVIVGVILVYGIWSFFPHG